MENALWDLTGFEVKFEVLKNQVKVHYDENKQDIQIAAIPFLEYTRSFTKNLKKINYFQIQLTTLETFCYTILRVDRSLDEAYSFA